MSRPRWPVLLYCLLSWAGAFFHLILFSFLKRDLQSALSLSAATLGWIDGLTFASAALGGLVLGRAADLGARRAVLALTPAIPALGSWLMSGAEGGTGVIVARLLVGFGVGGGWGVGHAILADVYTGRERLRAAAILQTGGPLGVIVAAFAGCILVSAAPDGWRSVLAWSGATAAIAILDPWAMRGLPPASPSPIPAQPGRVPRAAMLIFGLLVLQMTAYWCTFGWLPSHLVLQGASRQAVGWMQMATGGTQALADLGFGWLSQRAGLRRVFAVCNLAFAAGVIALAFAFQAIEESPIALTATICAVGLGSGSWAAFGPLYAEHVPAAIRSSVSATSYHLARASQVIVQPLVATIGAGVTVHPTPFLVAAAAAAAGAVLIRFLRH